jgi:multidrug efflux pump subunit AcrA (membrane-fusion protein)
MSNSIVSRKVLAKISFLSIGLLIAALLLAACGGGDGGEAATTEGDSTEIPRQVPSLPASGSVVANGHLTPVRYERLSSKAGGLVVEILVSEGQQVNAGDTLLRLKVDEDLQAELASAEYEKLQAQQALDDLTNKHDIALNDAKDEYAKARQANYDAERKASYQADQSSTFVKDQADLELEVAKEKLSQATDRYELLQNGPDPEELQATQARLDSAEARLEAAQAAVDDLELTASMDGTVLQIVPHVGDIADPGQILVTIADVGAWQVETEDLNEIEVVKISQGQVATIVPDALPDVQMTGTVQSISGVSEDRAGDVVYRAVIALNEVVDPRVRWGMTVAVTFVK